MNRVFTCQLIISFILKNFNRKFCTLDIFNCKELKQKMGVSCKFSSLLLPFWQHSSIDFLPTFLPLHPYSMQHNSFHSIFGYELRLEIFLNRLENKQKQKTIPTCKSSQATWLCICVCIRAIFFTVRKRKSFFFIFSTFLLCLLLLICMQCA